MSVLKLISKEYKVNSIDATLLDINGSSFDCGKLGVWMNPVFRTIDKINGVPVYENIGSILAVSEDRKFVLKLEVNIHPRKRRSLVDEVKIIRFLNKKNCGSVVDLVEDGSCNYFDIKDLFLGIEVNKRFEDVTYKFVIMKLAKSDPGYKISDVLMTIFEQQSLGVYHGDIKPTNICFDSSTGICFFIDFDQAELLPDDVVKLGAYEFLMWCDKKEQERYGHTAKVWTRHFDWLSYKRHINWLFRSDGAFNLATTTPYHRQITTNTKNGVYHTIESSKIFASGIRDLNQRFNLLEKVKFDNNEKVLDVGCNAGLLTHYLYKRGCVVTGYEMDKWIVAIAKMIANILGVKSKYKAVDLDDLDELDKFDTICLFSVIHHTTNIAKNGAMIADSCNRILVECRLHERGNKPIESDGGIKWVRSTVWDYDNEDQLRIGLSKLFPMFEVLRNIGSADRDRFLFELVKK